LVSAIPISAFAQSRSRQMYRRGVMVEKSFVGIEANSVRSKGD
jgi:hypothetical protein